MLLLAALLPALNTLLSFPLQFHPEITYPVLKVIMLLVPLLWFFEKNRSWRKAAERWGLFWQRGDAWWGLGSGLGISALIFTLYRLFFAGRMDASGIMEIVPPFMLQYYWLTTLGISLGNSLAEEYYWRAFLYGEGRRYLSPVSTVILTGALFGLHHIVILQGYFSWPQALFFTLGTMTGGWIWAGLRAWGCSLWACYLSHLLVDFTIMGIGYEILQHSN